MSIKLDIRERGRGRTNDLLAWARDHSTEERVIVSATCQRSHDLQYLNRDDPDLESWQFVSWDEFAEPGRGFMWGVQQRGKPIVYAIDDFDTIITQVLGVGHNVDRVTMSTEIFSLMEQADR
jgi:hypothetical protein